MAIKECVICGQQFNVSNRRVVCSPDCKHQRVLQLERLRYAADPEKFREKVNARRAADPEKFRKQARDRRAADPEKFRARDREYCESNREKLRVKARNFYSANAERCREWSRSYKNSQYAASSMLEACAAMIQINEIGNNHETE